MSVFVEECSKRNKPWGRFGASDWWILYAWRLRFRHWAPENIFESWTFTRKSRTFHGNNNNRNLTHFQLELVSVFGQRLRNTIASVHLFVFVFLCAICEFGIFGRVVNWNMFIEHIAVRMLSLNLNLAVFNIEKKKSAQRTKTIVFNGFYGSCVHAGFQPRA